MTEYQDIRQRLMARHEEIRGRQNRVSQDLRHVENPLDTTMEEQAQELENDQVLEALDGSLREEMERIERALVRLDQGEYGVCETCGRLITLKRLEALPFTTQCVECAAAREETLGGV